MKYYNVNGLKFTLERTFDEYFIDNIEKYEMESCEVSHHIESKVVTEINVPVIEPTLRIGNREIYDTEEKETIIVYKNGIPALLIEKRLDFKKVCIYLRSNLEGLSELEYVYSGIVFMELCLYHSIQSIHGSAILYEEKAIIFSAPSGVGKSTHVEYWKKMNSSISIINDDKPLLSLKESHVMVSGSPWSGKTKVNENVTVPLHSIVFLNQGTKNEVIELSKKEKVIYLMRNINRPRQDELWKNIEDILTRLIEDVPMYRASVTNDIEAAYKVREQIGV